MVDLYSRVDAQFGAGRGRTIPKVLGHNEAQVSLDDLSTLFSCENDLSI